MLTTHGRKYTSIYYRHVNADVIMNGGRCGLAEYSVTSPCEPSGSTNRPSPIMLLKLKCTVTVGDGTKYRLTCDDNTLARDFSIATITVGSMEATIILKCVGIMLGVKHLRGAVCLKRNVSSQCSHVVQLRLLVDEIITDAVIQKVATLSLRLRAKGIFIYRSRH